MRHRDHQAVMLAGAVVPRRTTHSTLPTTRGAPPGNATLQGLSTLAGEHLARGATTGVTTARSVLRHALRVAVLLLRRSVLVSALGEHERICALGGEVDEFRTKTDIDARMSAYGGKAEVDFGRLDVCS